MRFMLYLASLAGYEHYCSVCSSLVFYFFYFEGGNMSLLPVDQVLVERRIMLGNIVVRSLVREWLRHLFQNNLSACLAPLTAVEAAIASRDLYLEPLLISLLFVCLAIHSILLL